MRSWRRSGWAWVDLSSASGGGFACGEDVSLGHRRQWRWFAFLFPLTCSLQERGVILVRIDWTNKQSCPSLMIRRRLFLSGQSSLQEGREHPTFSCLTLEVFCFPVSRVLFCLVFLVCFLFLSNSSSKSLWYFLLFTRLHCFLLVFVKWRHVWFPPWNLS